jgi:hypothetical protein
MCHLRRFRVTAKNEVRRGSRRLVCEDRNLAGGGKAETSISHVIAGQLYQAPNTSLVPVYDRISFFGSSALSISKNGSPVQCIGTM